MAKTKTLFTWKYKIKNLDAWLYFGITSFFGRHQLFGWKRVAGPRTYMAEWMKCVTPNTKERKIEEINDLIKFCRELRFELEGGNS